VPFVVLHRIELSPAIESLFSGTVATLEAAMSALTAKLDALEIAVASAVAKTAEDVGELNRKIAELAASVEAGTATPEEIARLEVLTAQIAAIDPDPSFPPPPPVE
jgi:outer membrane murein-binding lipoprotein Lpp